MSKPLHIEYSKDFLKHLLNEKGKEIERLHSGIKEIKEYIEFLKQTDEVILEEGINKIIDTINEMLGSDKE